MHNLILSLLSKAGIRALAPKVVKLRKGDLLYEDGSAVEKVYFPRGSVISLLAPLSTGQAIEAAMVGRDGIIGASAALNGTISVGRAIVQISGLASVCSSDELKAAAMKSAELLSVLLKHEQAVYAQAQQFVACNTTHQIEPRLARWLLRARDLSQSDDLSFTQESLAEMLGVQRSSVSPVAQNMQGAGIIEYSRANIRIMDSERLHAVACECYDMVNQRYNTLLGEQAFGHQA